MSEYHTIQGRAVGEIEEKKSRFIANICHVETEEEALAFLEEIRAEHRMARHNVYAYILRGEGASERIRYSDDGEPQKTAGLPTLDVLQHAGLTDVIAVVTRYFGGTLLGTGGLVRAYTQATQAGIAAAKVVVISKCVDVTLAMPYSFYDQMVRLAADFNAETIDVAYTDSITATYRLLDGAQAPFLKKITELFRGEEDLLVSEPFDAEFAGVEPASA